MLRIRNTVAVLVMSCLAFSAWSQGQSQKIVVDKIMGAVGDRIILQSEIQNTIADMMRYGQEVPPNAACLMLEQSLISKILALQAERDSLPVSDEEVEAQMDLRTRNFVMQYGSIQAVEEIAGKSIYQLKEEFRPQIKEQMLADAKRRDIVENVHITPTEVKSFYERIPQDSIPYLESELEVGQINIYPQSAPEVDEYIYNEMLNYKKQIESGTVSFESMAQKYSEDPGSRERGGTYEINRNDKIWDPVFMSTIFRLKVGEISQPVKSPKFGFFLIQLDARRGDNANVKMILRTPPVTDVEINAAKAKLDSVRNDIIAGKINFKDAAYRYSEDEAVKNYGPYVLNQDGSTHVNIDQLDKEMALTVGNMKVGDYSQPVAFTNQQGKRGVRIIYLRSRTDAHRMNLADDYSRISDLALTEKKNKALESWLEQHVPDFYVLVDKEAAQQCTNLQKFNSTSNRGF